MVATPRAREWTTIITNSFLRSQVGAIEPNTEDNQGKERTHSHKKIQEQLETNQVVGFKNNNPKLIAFLYISINKFKNSGCVRDGERICEEN